CVMNFLKGLFPSSHRQQKGEDFYPLPKISNLFYIIPKKLLSPTFTECSPNIHFENKKVGDNIILSPYRRKGVLHWTQNTKKASGA
nr:hypothetical protein [Clostridia bacterium]